MARPATINWIKTAETRDSGSQLEMMRGFMLSPFLLLPSNVVNTYKSTFLRPVSPQNG
jgi:hypothetical protein